MRVVGNINGQNGRVVFKEPSGANWNKMTVDFDFRMGELGAGGADGIGFALLNNVTSPNGADPGNVEGEEPHFVNALGIGLDTWDNGQASAGLPDGGVAGGVGPTQQSLSVHWNNAVLDGAAKILHQDSPHPEWIGAATLVDPQHNLKTGNWGHAHYEVTAAGNVSATLTTVENGDDVTSTVLDNFLVPGFAPYDGHVYFAARTGGANENTDIDNVNVQFSAVPEPSSIVMGCMALAGLAAYGYRRRKAA